MERTATAFPTIADKSGPGPRGMTHEPGCEASIVGAALDDDRTVVPGTPAMIVEGDGAVTAVVEAVAFVVDDDDRAVMMMMPVVRPDDDIGLGRGNHGRRGDAERQSGKKHCFHCDIPRAVQRFAGIAGLL